MMRTTIDLPDDLHQRAKAIARDTDRSLGDVVATLMRRGLEADGPRDVAVSADTGLPIVTLGRVVTSDDVRALDDEA
jgi:predicted transcriptional regulator